MSTVSAAAGALSAQAIWNRFVASLDRDNDGSLGADELAALSSPEKAEKAVNANDANGDGKLDADEMPKGAFSPVVAGVLLDAQEYRNASPEQRRADDDKAIAQMFARADTDGDGVLSQAEWNVERALSMSRYLDSGELPDIAFIAKRQTTDGLTTVDVPTEGAAGDGAGAAPDGLRPEDFLVGRKANIEMASADDLPDDWSDRLAELRRAGPATSADGDPLLQVLDAETVRADMMARIEATPMDAAFMTRLIMSLGEYPAQDASA